MSKPRLTDQDFCRAATRLGCEPAAVAAVAEQESLQAGFDEQDRPTILFERHIFHHLTYGRFDHSHSGISNATPGGYGPTHAQYGRFNEAFALDPDAAMKACSWGKFQILGKNYAICGFANVGAFVDAMKVSEATHLDAFCAFVLHEGLDDALTDHDWTRFADGYNGSGQRKHHYDALIAAKFAHWRHHDFKCSENPNTQTTRVGNPISAAGQPATDELATGNVVESVVEPTPATQSPAGDETASTAQPPIQNAENIINTGDQTVPADFVPQDKTVDAPPKEGTVTNTTTMTIAGFAVPTFLVGLIKAIESAMTNGYISATQIGDAVLGFIQNNTKFVFAGLGLVIAGMFLKKLYKQITLWLQMYFAARPDMHNVTVKPQ